MNIRYPIYEGVYRILTNQRKKARNNPCLITTKAAFGSLLFYSLRCCCTICTFILYLFSFTAFRNALAGLNAGML